MKIISTKKPNLFIVGQPRCGTTALHNFLAQHPEVFMSPDKEPHHFCKDIIQESDAYYRKKTYYLKYRSEVDYLELFKNVRNETIIGESTANYLYSNVAAKLIYNFNPQAKIIMLLREPVSFLYSWYSYLVYRLQETANNFELALALEEKRKAGKNTPNTIEAPSRLYYSDKVKYYEQVSRYFDVFDKSNIKVIIYEDFKEQNDVVYEQVLRFLGVDTSFVPDFTRVNISRNARFVKFNKLLLNPFSTKIALACLPVRFRAKTKILLNKILFDRKKPIPIDSSLRQELMCKYKPEVIKISDFLGIDLVKRWKYDEVPD
jgi:hypothetical protein